MRTLWEDIIGFEGYQVSNQGEVRSLDRQILHPNGVLHTVKGRILSPNDNGKGYLSVQLGKNNRRYIHKLVLAAFIDGGSYAAEVNHKNLIKSDNRAANLEITTRKQNQRHMILNGKHNKAKITKNDLLRIVKLKKVGFSLKSIARQLKVSKSTISSILTNKTWSWL